MKKIKLTQPNPVLAKIISFFRPKHPSEMTDEEWFEEMAWWYQF